MDRARFLIPVIAIAFLAVAVQAGLSPEQVSFLVNNVTAGQQRQPAVDYSGDGSGLFVWDSDIAGQGEIEGRWVAPDGTLSSSQFRISPPTSTSQIRPAVAGFHDTGFVVAWESYVFETDEDEILVQRVSSVGDLLGEPIRIADTEFHLHADVAIGADGGFIVVWDDGFDINARRFESSGAAAGGMFRVNQQLGTMYGPRVASDANGAFAVVWEDQSEIDSDGAGILLRRFDPNGNALSGDIQVNSTLEGDQYGAAIAMRPGGEFVVVWESYGQPGVGDGAFAQVFEASGSRLGGQFRVDSGASAFAGYVDAAVAGDGFVVLWSEPREEGSEILTTMIRRFDAGGVGGSIVDVDPEDESDQAFGTVASFAGNALVGWQGFGPEDEDIFGQRFAVLGEFQTPTNTNTPLATQTPTLPLTPTTGCAGDCDGNGTVSIAELIRAVNIALGTADLSTCTAADRDGSGTVQINELIAAVNSALLGCS